MTSGLIIKMANTIIMTICAEIQNQSILNDHGVSINMENVAFVMFLNVVG